MALIEELPVRPRGFARAAPRIILVACVAIASALIVTVLTAGGDVGAQLVRVTAASLGAWLVHRGWMAASGRERRTRGWLLAAAVIWLVSELGRLAGVRTGEPTILAELSVVGLGFAAAGTFVAAARGRMRAPDEMALYLDAVAVFFGLLAATVLFGSGFTGDGESIAALAHGGFFLALLAATLLLDLSTHAPLRFVGPWEVLAGLGLGAAGYL